MVSASKPGIAVNPKFTYVLVEADGRKFVVAKDLLETVQSEIGWENVTVLKICWTRNGIYDCKSSIL